MYVCVQHIWEQIPSINTSSNLYHSTRYLLLWHPNLARTDVPNAKNEKTANGSLGEKEFRAKDAEPGPIHTVFKQTLKDLKCLFVPTK